MADFGLKSVMETEITDNIHRINQVEEGYKDKKATKEYNTNGEAEDRRHMEVHAALEKVNCLNAEFGALSDKIQKLKAQLQMEGIVKHAAQKKSPTAEPRRHPRAGNAAGFHKTVSVKAHYRRAPQKKKAAVPVV